METQEIIQEIKKYQRRTKRQGEVFPVRIEFYPLNSRGMFEIWGKKYYEINDFVGKRDRLEAVEGRFVDVLAYAIQTYPDRFLEPKEDSLKKGGVIVKIDVRKIRTSGLAKKVGRIRYS